MSPVINVVAQSALQHAPEIASAGLGFAAGLLAAAHPRLAAFLRSFSESLRSR